MKLATTFSVKMPNYLSFTGNYAIVSDEDFCLLIWPDLWKPRCKYGVLMNDNNASYSCYVNRTGDYLFSKDMPLSEDEELKVKELLDNNRNILLDMLNRAQIEWNLPQ